MKLVLKIIVVSVLLSFIWMSKKVDLVTFGQLQEQAAVKNNDTLYVLNFWATWCGPCVKEIPFFEESSKIFANQKVKIIYVCLNSAKEIAGVESFVKAKKIQNTVLLLNETNPNNWIDRVDSEWSGSIPATVMYKGGDKVFFKEGDFTQVELDEAIVNMNKTIINTNEK
jgi:thiol-disulfide isomerase/thioredoxin